MFRRWASIIPVWFPKWNQEFGFELKGGWWKYDLRGPGEAGKRREK